MRCAHCQATIAPLIGCNSPKDRIERQRQPERDMHPIGRGEGDFDRERQRHHDVADDEDDEIGRRVVGAVMMQILAAGRALIGDFQERAEQLALAAIRAAAAQIRGARQHRRASTYR